MSQQENIQVVTDIQKPSFLKKIPAKKAGVTALAVVATVGAVVLAKKFVNVDVETVVETASQA